MCNCIQSSVSGHNVHTHHSISCEHSITDVYGDVLQPPPSAMLLQLKDDLGKKNMLFPKSCIELTRVIGQGIYWGPLCTSYVGRNYRRVWFGLPWICQERRDE